MIPSPHLLTQNNNKHSLCSGDGSLSYINYKSKKHYESVEIDDELLSVVSLCGDTKVVAGTQDGDLLIFKVWYGMVWYGMVLLIQPFNNYCQ